MAHNISNVDQLRTQIEKKKRLPKKAPARKDVPAPVSFWDRITSRRLDKDKHEPRPVSVPTPKRPETKWKYEKIIEYVDSRSTSFTTREVANHVGCPVATVQAVLSKIGADFIVATGKAKYDTWLALYDKTSKWNKDDAVNRYRRKPPNTAGSSRDVVLEFEKCRERLREHLNLSQEVVERTLLFIKEYQPFRQKELRTQTSIPRYLQPDMVIGGCLYLACEVTGLSISQSDISIALGNVGLVPLGWTVKEIRMKLATLLETEKGKPIRDRAKKNHTQRVPITETRCWSCERLESHTGGAHTYFGCAKNPHLPRLLPVHFGAECASFIKRKQLNEIPPSESADRKPSALPAYVKDIGTTDQVLGAVKNHLRTANTPETIVQITEALDKQVFRKRNGKGYLREASRRGYVRKAVNFLVETNKAAKVRGTKDNAQEPAKYLSKG